MSETRKDETEYRIFGLPVRVSESVPEGGVFVAHGEMARVVEAMTKPATSTSPEQGEVREALVRVLEGAGETYELAVLLGLDLDDNEGIADALLARATAEGVTAEQAFRALSAKVRVRSDGPPADLLEALAYAERIVSGDDSLEGRFNLARAFLALGDLGGAYIEHLRATPPAAETGRPIVRVEQKGADGWFSPPIKYAADDDGQACVVTVNDSVRVTFWYAPPSAAAVTEAMVEAAIDEHRKANPSYAKIPRYLWRTFASRLAAQGREP